MTPTPRSRRATALTLGAAALAALTGCSSGGGGETATSPTPSSPPCLVGTSLALIVPVHVGAQAPGIPAEWDCALDDAIRGGIPISVVTAEGNPQVLVKASTATINTTKGNDLYKADHVAAAKNALIDTVVNATASSDGNDLLAAFALAADLAPGGQIMSLDNGATDSGTVRTVEKGMTTVVDPADVAQLVTDSDACPAVTGARVQLYGLGYQVPPADTLSQRQRDRVGLIWQTVLEACGATTELIALPRTGDGPHTTHTARAITPEADPQMPTPAACETVLPDTVIGFVADQATFTDPDLAMTIIGQAADQLAACPGTIEVIGTTSSAGTPEGRARLSTKRAEAVRELLADRLNVPVETITARGLGYNRNEGRCIDDRPSGVLDPVLAAQNRKVIIRVHP